MVLQAMRAFTREGGTRAHMMMEMMMALQGRTARVHRLLGMPMPLHRKRGTRAHMVLQVLGALHREGGTRAHRVLGILRATYREEAYGHT